MLVPNTNTRARCTGDDEAPLRPGTRRTTYYLQTERRVGVCRQTLPMVKESAAEFEAKAKVRRAKVKADMEAKAARDLGIEVSPCTDRLCAVCTDPDVCEQCRRGSTLVQTPPSRVDTLTTYDDAGWEVEDDVSSADWPKVCQSCSTGCRACDGPSPAGCTACYPMYARGSEGT